METQISIVDTYQEISLNTSKEDMMALFARSIFSLVPFGGPIGEAIAAVIPNQKLERVIDFVQVLNYKIKNAEREIEEHELKTEEFTDLLEDALGQASRSLTEERLEYIASLLKNSLTKDELSHVEEKRLLSLLNELNDAEIIWLKSYSLNQSIGSKEYIEFREAHKDILEPVRILYGGVPGSIPQELFDKEAIQKSYQNNLVNLRLISESFKSVANGEVPEFDGETGKMKVRGYNCSSLGELLLRYIDLSELNEAEEE